MNDRQGDIKDSLTLFLVDKSMPGIEIHEEDKTIGLTNMYQSKVTFNNVLISKGKQTKNKQKTNVHHERKAMEIVDD